MPAASTVRNPVSWWALTPASAGGRGRVGDQLGQRHRLGRRSTSTGGPAARPSPRDRRRSSSVGERRRAHGTSATTARWPGQHVVGQPLVRAEQPQVRAARRRRVRAGHSVHRSICSRKSGRLSVELGPDRLPARGSGATDACRCAACRPRAARRTSASSSNTAATSAGSTPWWMTTKNPISWQISRISSASAERRRRRQVEDRDLGELPGRHVPILRPGCAEVEGGSGQRSARCCWSRSTRRPQLASVRAIQSAAGRREPATRGSGPRGRDGPR